jgi:hypothetical protein
LQKIFIGLIILSIKQIQKFECNLSMHSQYMIERYPKRTAIIGISASDQPFDRLEREG